MVPRGPEPDLGAVEALVLPESMVIDRVLGFLHHGKLAANRLAEGSLLVFHNPIHPAALGAALEPSPVLKAAQEPTNAAILNC